MIKAWYNNGNTDDFIVIKDEHEEAFVKDVRDAIKNDSRRIHICLNGKNDFKEVVRVDDGDEIVYMHPDCEIK